MEDLLYRLVGRSCVWCEMKLQRILRSREGPERGPGVEDLDRTGILVSSARRLPVLWQAPDLLYAGYDSPAHSLWRAQELSLFLRWKPLFERPVLDFGCGDGSFASALFERIEFGVDIDPDALAVAEKYGIYGRLVRSSRKGIPLEPGVARTVISNSVLEHVLDLEIVLSELARVLSGGGRFFFTVPVVSFKAHLAKYFGAEEAERVNVQYYHRNLLDSDGWTTRLRLAGFEIERVIPFQPERFTYWYRMLRLFGRKGLGRISPRIGERFWGLCRRRLVRMVRASLRGTPDGANIFVVARKR